MRLTIIAAFLLAASAAQAGGYDVEACEKYGACVQGGVWPPGYRTREQEMNDRMDRLEERQRQFENYMRAFEDPPDRR